MLIRSTFRLRAASSSSETGVAVQGFDACRLSSAARGFLFDIATTRLRKTTRRADALRCFVNRWGPCVAPVSQTGSMSGHQIYVEVLVRAELETLWQLTQDPARHPRWDLRFSAIVPTTGLDSGGSRFIYERRLPLHTIRGTGTSLGESHRPDGTRTSAQAPRGMRCVH